MESCADPIEHAQAWEDIQKDNTDDEYGSLGDNVYVVVDLTQKPTQMGVYEFVRSVLNNGNRVEMDFNTIVDGWSDTAKPFNWTLR